MATMSVALDRNLFLAYYSSYNNYLDSFIKSKTKTDWVNAHWLRRGLAETWIIILNEVAISNITTVAGWFGLLVILKFLRS